MSKKARDQVMTARLVKRHPEVLELPHVKRMQGLAGVIRRIAKLLNERESLIAW